MNVEAGKSKTWNSSLRNSIVIHVFLLLIAWLFKLQNDPSQTIDTQYAVTVNFQNIEFNDSKSSNSTKSSAAEGRQRPKAESPQKIEASTPKKVETPKITPPKPTPTPPATDPTPTDPVFSETTTEVSDIQAIEEEIPVDDPEPEYIPEAAPEPEPAPEVVYVENTEIENIEDIIGDISDEPIDVAEETDIIADKESDTATEGSSSSSDSGSSDGDPSLKDGDEGGTGKGDSGTGKGNDAGGNDNDSGIGTGDHGEGEFDASGDGIFGRQPIHRDPSMIVLASSKSGKIVFKVCINPRGTVRYLEIDEFNTTIIDKGVLRKALESMRKYKFEVDYSAPKEECGKFTVSVDNFRGISG